jgi:heterodisulfide reductase subunit E
MLQIPNEIFSYMLLFGVAIATVRRVFVPKIRDNTSRSDTVLLGGLIIVVLTGFISQGIRTGGLWGFGLENQIAPPSALFHSVISLLFCIALIPYTKYIHIIATPLTILMNKGGE